MTTTTRLCRTAVLLAVAALTVGATAAPASAAGGTWTIEPSVIPQHPTGGLADISCVPGAQTHCLAVGSAISPVGDLTSTTQLWDGSSWQDVGSPQRATADVTTLRGVSCTASLTCMAVGNDSGANSVNRTLAAQWTSATGWRVLPTPTPAAAPEDLDDLEGVACPSVNRCVAVGFYYAAEDRVSTALVETWNGSRWRIATHPLGAQSSLGGVSCTSVHSCVAHGSRDGHLVALRWDGTAWTVEPMPDPAGAAELHAISCSSAQACMAVGERYDSGSGRIFTFAERWDGTSWSITRTPNVPDVIETQLFDVSCVAADACVAVGASAPYNQQHTVVETWDGARWQLTRSPDGGKGTTRTQFEGVSCVSASDCVAVGAFGGDGLADPGVSFSARWDGARWTALPGGSAIGAAASRFDGLSCVDAENCVAVGSTRTDGPGSRTLAEVRTAAGWRVTPTPQAVGAQSTLLAGVSCAAANACMAVGRAYNGRLGGWRTNNVYAVWWDGTSWARLSPIRSRNGDQFRAVSCATPWSCVAVGDNRDGALAETWDGTSWTKIDITRPPGALDSRLTGISCTTAAACVAVGDYDTSASTTIYTFAAVEDGESWLTTDLGQTGYQPEVSCPSATFCAAVGTYDATGATAQLWNGSSWSAVPLPVRGADAVSCITPTSCVAVGQNHALHPRELVEVWNGTRWRVDTDVEPSGFAPGGPTLNAVSCVSVSTCTAAGTRAASINDTPLIESTSG